MTFISYAQNFEDVLLWRALGNIEEGHYLDIGAQDPVVDSVSLAFYNAGWRGTHVEPTAEYAGQLRKARPDETVIQAVVTDKPGPITFYEIPGTGISTGRKEIAKSHLKFGFPNRKVVVPSVRLGDLLAMHSRDIHWMKIDVEGMEDSVLRSWGDSPVRPWVLVIEATYPRSQKPAHSKWISEVSGRGYQEVYFDGLSKFFVHEKHQDLAKWFTSPPNVFDEFSIAKAHFAAKTLREQFDAAVEANIRELDADKARLQSDFEAQRTSYEAEAQQKIDAAAVESAQLRSDLSAAVERVIGAQREHRETITRLWGERQASEANLRRERREEIEKVEAELRRVVTDAESDKRVFAAAIATLNEELRTANHRLSEIAAREHEMRRSYEQELRDLRAHGAEEIQRASAAVELARQERDSARAYSERSLKERDEARAIAERCQRERDEAHLNVERIRTERDQARGHAECSLKEWGEDFANPEQTRVFVERLRAERDEATAKIGLLQAQIDVTAEAQQLGKSRDRANRDAITGEPVIQSLVDSPLEVDATNHEGTPIRPNSRFSHLITLKNSGDWALEWSEAHPLTLSYRWLAEDGEVLDPDGRRTFLPVSVLVPGERLELNLVGETPNFTGLCELQVSLVLEGVHWACDVSMTGWSAVPLQLAPAPAWPDDLLDSIGARALRGALVASQLEHFSGN